MAARTADVAVVGAGLVGLATARALAVTHGARVVVFDKEPAVAAHQSSHNSGVIHSGLYYVPGSARARLCAEGRVRMVDYCRERGIAHDVCGKVVVATRDEEVPRLDALAVRGRENGLDVRRIDAAALREIEPHAAGVAALFVPEAGIADYPGVAKALAADIAAHGGAIECRAAFRTARDGGAGLEIEVSDGTWHVAALAACAGLQADRVAAACGVATDIVIAPFRGEYYALAPARQSLVRHLIYPVPDPRFPFLGVHLTRMALGGVEAGPNAVMALAREGYTWADVSARDVLDALLSPGVRRFVGRHVGTGVAEIHRSFSKRRFAATLARLVPALTAADLAPGGSGVRAMALTPAGTMVDDFAFVEAGRMVHVLNAPSPAATASLAIGHHIASRVLARLA
ncbi:MAG: L-2-hydroxyglutarate oxidase [Vicinamibacterales bacterium]